MVGRKTDAVSPRRRDRTKRPTAWAKKSGVEMVVAYTPTARRGTSTPSDTMRTATIQRSSLVAELVDALRGAGVVGEDDGRLGAGDLADQLGVRAGRVLVGGDDEAAGVRDALADLGQPLVGGAQHVRHPVAARVERGAPGLRDRVLGHRLAEPGGDLVAGLGAPAHVAAVGEEDDGPDDAVGERVAVAVGVVGGGPPDAVVALLVRDEGDGVGVGPERRTGQREPPGGRARTPPGTPRPRTWSHRRGGSRRG